MAANKTKDKNMLTTIGLVAVVLIVGFALFRGAGPNVSGFATLSASVSVQSVCILSSDTSTVNFGSVGPTSTSAEQTVVLTNEGNAAQNISVKGADWSGADTMVVGSTHYDVTSGTAYSAQNALTTSDVVAVTDQAASASDSVYLKLQVPAGQAAGSYAQTITLTETC